MHTLASFYSLETKMKEKLMLPLSEIVVYIYIKFPLVSTTFFFFFPKFDSFMDYFIIAKKLIDCKSWKINVVE